MTAERMGIPAVAVITTPFVDGAALMASTLGYAGYRFAVIDHPISSADPGGLAARAAATADQADQLLFRP
ncbi:MAG: hypothetical protein ACK5PP_11360 [Acidimicrobiales bacterium]